MTGRLRIVVLGYVVRGPLGGLAWHHLQYVLGLRSLGHEVLYLETAVDDPAGCYDPSVDAMGCDPSYGLRFAVESFSRVGHDRWAFLLAAGDRWVGPGGSEVEAFCRDADVLVDVSGVNELVGPVASIPVRVLVDTDPVFQQVRVLTEPNHRAHVERHTAWFTFATSWGTAGCEVPDDGVDWQPTVQPIHLDAWCPTPVPPGGSLTTVMQWDSYRRRSWAGKEYGMKAESFAPYRDLPGRVAVPLEIALGSAGAPREDLLDRGWTLHDPLAVTRTVDTYRDHLAASLGEFSVAKHGYVVSGSGWFSERTANYLASGRPAVVQDTGFSRWLPCGEGLLAFASPDQAVAAIAEVVADPARHGRRARELAEAHFDARRVLTDLLDRCG